MNFFSYRRKGLMVFLLFILTTVAVPAVAAELMVPSGHKTIQGALNAAAPGDAVIVAPGRYSENLVITKSVILRSSGGMEGTVVAPASPGEPALTLLGVSNSTVMGFTFTGSNRNAVHLLNASSNSFFANSFTVNLNGLFLENSNKNRIYENSFTDNEKGLYLYFSDANLIENNIADSNTNNGILLHSSHGNRITGNTANANTWNGITLSASNDNLIDGNRAISNTYAIVVSESSGNKIVDNTTRRRIYLLLPVFLVYFAIMLYLIERKAFIFYYHWKYKDRGRMHGLR